MNRIAKFGGVAVLSVGLLGCQAGAGPGPNQVLGGLSGAASGLAIGSQIGQGTGNLIAMGVGALVGAVVGSMAGAQLDQRDQARRQGANQGVIGLPKGTTARWYNPKTGNQGSAQPSGKLYTDAKGRQCQNITQEIEFANGQKKKQVIVYCRNNQGAWAPAS